MNKALNRSWSGVVPDVLSRVALNESIWTGVTCTDMFNCVRVCDDDTERILEKMLPDDKIRLENVVRTLIIWVEVDRFQSISVRATAILYYLPTPHET